MGQRETDIGTATKRWGNVQQLNVRLSGDDRALMLIGATLKNLGILAPQADQALADVVSYVSGTKGLDLAMLEGALKAPGKDCTLRISAAVLGGDGGIPMSSFGHGGRTIQILLDPNGTAYAGGVGYLISFNHRVEDDPYPKGPYISFFAKGYGFDKVIATAFHDACNSVLGKNSIGVLRGTANTPWIEVENHS